MVRMVRMVRYLADRTFQLWGEQRPAPGEARRAGRQRDAHACCSLELPPESFSDKAGFGEILALKDLLGRDKTSSHVIRYEDAWLEAELKGSIGEGPNHSNRSNHSNSFKIGIFLRKFKF